MVQPIVPDPTKVEGNFVPLELEVRIAIAETREPSVGGNTVVQSGDCHLYTYKSQRDGLLYRKT